MVINGVPEVPPWPEFGMNLARSHFGSSHFGCLPGSVSASSLFMTTLDGVFASIAGAVDLRKAEREWLRSEAVRAAFGATATPAATATSHKVASRTECDALELFYGEVSQAAGQKISRPSKAVAFMRAVGLDDFVSRFSKLTSRRRHMAHPDATLVDDVAKAFAGLDGAWLEKRAGEFRSCSASESPLPDTMTVSSQSVSSCESDRETNDKGQLGALADQIALLGARFASLENVNQCFSADICTRLEILELSVAGPEAHDCRDDWHSWFAQTEGPADFEWHVLAHSASDISVARVADPPMAAGAAHVETVEVAEMADGCNDDGVCAKLDEDNVFVKDIEEEPVASAVGTSLGGDPAAHSLDGSSAGYRPSLKCTLSHTVCGGVRIVTHSRDFVYPGPKTYSDFEECLLAYDRLEQARERCGGKLPDALAQLLDAMAVRALELDPDEALCDSVEQQVQGAAPSTRKARRRGKARR